MFVSKARSHAFHVACCCCSVSCVRPYVQRVRGAGPQRTSRTGSRSAFSLSPKPLIYIFWPEIPYGLSASCFHGLADRVLREFCDSDLLGTTHVTYSRLTTIFFAPEEIQQACNKSCNYTIENAEYVNTGVLIGNTFAAAQPGEGSFQ